MNYKHNFIKERFDFTVSQANQTVKHEFELDKNALVLLGVAVTSDKEEHLYYRGSQKIQVNDQELFPDGFESKLLMTGLTVSPNDRLVKVGFVKTGNKKVEIWFKDEDHPRAPFAAYRVSFYFFSSPKC